MTDRLERQFAFLAEIDKLKSIVRQSPLINRSRRENSAEHSWHLALFALVLAAEEPQVDPGAVVTMLLLHDLVEIDAGDAPIHSALDAAAIADAEMRAAIRLFGLLPPDQGERLHALWIEFEAAETPTARFAKAIDRLQPLMLNTLAEGGTWAESDVGEQQVMERYGPVIRRGSPRLWEHAAELVRGYFSASRSAPRRF